MASHRTSTRLARCAAALCLLTVAQVATAQLPDLSNFTGGLRAGGASSADDKVKLAAEFTKPTGDSPAMLFVTAKVAPGLHISAIDQGKLPDGDGPGATVITVAQDAGYKLLGPFKPIQQPTTHIDQKIWKGLELREHLGEVTWYAPVEIAAGVDPANIAVKGSFDGQACDDNSCTPIRLAFTADLGDGMPIPKQTVPVSPTANMSLWAIAGYGMLGGFILNFMPCVLPVIGLKVLSFAEQAGRSRAKILGLNLSYAAGMLTVFLVLATLAAAVQLGISEKSYGWGQLNTLTWFKVAMTGLVFSMALSFLGVWELPIPGFAASDKATELSQQEGPFGAFCMGVFTTLLATPCSGPFLGSVLGFTLSQPPAISYLVFGSVGVGMALPYLLIGLFPSLVSWLPKPGHWMETLKHLLGFVLLATVLFLFSTIKQEYFLATLALMFGIWFACWLVGHVPIYAPLRTKAAAWLTGIAVATAVGFVSFRMSAPSESPLPWQPYSPQALAVARAQGKTVLVDFTADWCLTCKTNLMFSINTEPVKELVEKNDVVTLLADWTDESETIKQALLELNSQSIPLLAIYPSDPNREVVVLRDLISQTSVLDALADAGPSLDHEAAKVAGDQAAAAGAPVAPEFGAITPTTTTR
jgi:thiol:disulfide interchange protein